LEEKVYTFWDYFGNAYGSYAGLRMGHFLLSRTPTAASLLPVSTLMYMGKNKRSCFGIELN